MDMYDRIEKFHTLNFFWRFLCHLMFSLFCVWLMWDNPEFGQILTVANIVVAIFCYWKEIKRGSW